MSKRTAAEQSTRDVIAVLNEKSREFADRVALCLDDGGSKIELTYSQLHNKSMQLGSYLIEAGIQRGDRVAILCESRPEWGVCLFGSVRAGATVVPLDIKLTETELASILTDCAPKAVFCSPQFARTVASLREQLPSVEHVFLAALSAGAEAAFPSIGQLEPQAVRDGIERSTDEVALIVYTSGTTGNPKGVMISFGNLLFEVSSFKKMVEIGEQDQFLSILPLNHLLELTGGFLGVLFEGGTIHFCHSLFPQEIIKVMRAKAITGMVAVPLFYKSLKGAIEREVRKRGDAEWQKFQSGLSKADSLPVEMRQQIFAPVLEALGGRLRVLVCGGAPLDIETAQFFLRLGIPLLQGYGLTETSPVISGNTLRQNKPGSVGKALDGAEVKIDVSGSGETGGEILTRGPHVMKGYYNREDLTAEVIDDQGWLHTGDIGHLDEDGFLYITGRMKNLIVLGGGKKVFPEEVEAALSKLDCAKELCVVSRKLSEGFKQGTEEVCAVVVPSDALLKQHGDDERAMLKAIKAEIDQRAERLASYKRPTSVLVHRDELPKTATRKVKRPLVSDWVKAQSN